MLLYVPIMLPFFTYEQICLIADLATPIVAMISLVIAYFSLIETRKQIRESTAIQYKRDLVGLLQCVQDASFCIEEFVDAIGSYTEGPPEYQTLVNIFNNYCFLDFEDDPWLMNTVLKHKVDLLEQYELMAMPLLNLQVGTKDSLIVARFISAYRLFIISAWDDMRTTTALKNTKGNCCTGNIVLFPIGHCNAARPELYKEMQRMNSVLISTGITDKIRKRLYEKETCGNFPFNGVK